MTSRDNTRAKLHRRNVNLDKRRFTALSPRPTEPHRFSSIDEGGSWHIQADLAAVQFLGQLCWAMAYQQREQTIAVLDEPLLLSNSSGAAPSSPIVIVNSDLGVPTSEGFDELAASLPFSTPPEGTVRVMTRGLEVAAADPRAFYAAEIADGVDYANGNGRGWVEMVSGMVVFSAPAAVLKGWGVWLDGIDSEWHQGPESIELDDPHGEVQVIDHNGEGD